MTRSLWHDTASIPARPSLQGHLTADVCVVGAGIAGLSVAYHMAQAGKRVVVLEMDQIGSGETGRTTAHLSNAIDDRYVTLEKAVGAGNARLAAESHTAAIDAIERIVRAEDIDCDFARVDGWLFCAEGDSADLLMEELEAAHRAGLTGVTLESSVPARGWNGGPALRFPAQGRIHALRYLAGLARGIERAGGTIHCGSRVEKVEGGSPATVTTMHGATVSASDVVVCTNGSIADLMVTHIKQAPYRSFVVAFRVPKGSVPDSLYWDTGDPYHYVRLQPLDATSDALIVGGEDHKTAHEDDGGDRFARLERWARERWPSSGERLYQWSGQVLEPHDYLAFIGRNPDGAEHVWMSSGDSGMGMTHGTIAGLLLGDLLQGKEHRWARLYDPKRLTLHHTELATMAKENADVAKQFADWVTPGQVDDVTSIPAGEGRVIRRGLHKIAAYRDESGTVHERSAVCTHLKCIVDWNSAEKSWDCPCHGSRFSGTGKVIAGPATADLQAP